MPSTLLILWSLMKLNKTINTVLFSMSLLKTKEGQITIISNEWKEQIQKNCTRMQSYLLCNNSFFKKGMIKDQYQGTINSEVFLQGKKIRFPI